MATDGPAIDRKTPTLKKLVTETLTQLLQPSLFEKFERRWGLLINVLLSKLLGNFFEAMNLNM